MPRRSDPPDGTDPNLPGWRHYVFPVAALALAAAGVIAGHQLLDALLLQHENVMAVSRLRTEIITLAVLEQETDGRQAGARVNDLRAAHDRVLRHLDTVSRRLPEPEAGALRADVLAYVDAVEPATATTGDPTSDRGTGTGSLRRSLDSRLDRVVAEEEREARRTATAATRSLRVILVTTFFGVAGFAVGGSRVERQAGARRESKRWDARFQAIVENLQEFVAIIDDDGVLRYVSPSVEAELEPASTPTNVADLLDRLAPESREAFLGLLNDPRSAGPVLLQAVDFTGKARYIEMLASDQRENPHVGGLVITARDVTDRVLLEEQLRHQATTDELTGLPNRRALNAASERAVARARRHGSQVGLVLVDLDGFKGINDTMGHPVGDDLLIEVADRLGSACRGDELVARLGGDEFAVLLADIDGEGDAVTVARRLAASIDTPVELGDQLIAVHGSFGVAAGDVSLGFDDLFRRADVALYEAKERGRNQLVVFEPGMDYLMQAEMRLRREMDSGFQSGEFTMVYQPLVDVQTGRPTGVEALMRWNSSALGEVSPATFIPVAERSGTIVEFGLWGLRTACTQLVEWQRQGLCDQLSMSVNVSIAQLQQPGFVDQVTRMIDETGITPANLVLEVTESILAQRPMDVAAVLTRIRELGVKVALDDFGSGYSSMNQLQRLPVDEIKIDSAFVQALSEGAEGSHSMVSTLVSLGRALGLRTVAEGIEDLDQLRALETQQCDVGQGYLFARPMPPLEALDFLRTFTLPVGETR